MKPFNATIAYTCEIYQRSDVLAKYFIDKKEHKNSGFSKGNYVWNEYDHPLKFYEDIQGIAEYLRSLYGRLDGNSLLVELDGYIYNLTDYYVYRKFLDDFERSYI